MEKNYYPNTSLFHLTGWTPISVLFLGIFLCLSIQVFFPLTFGEIIDFVFEIGLTSSIKSHSFNSETQRTALKILIILTQTLGFGGTAFFIAIVAKEPQKMLGFTRPPFAFHVVLAMILTIIALPIIQFIMIDKNSINFPESFKFLQDFLLKQEDNTSEYLKELLKNNFALNLFFIAIIPGIMEELFFRGFIQNNLRKLLNVHAAIWITGFIFSAIHLQIFGFFPRMLLGVLFGYLYYWSGSIIPNIAAHFFNNAMSAIAAFYSINSNNKINALGESYEPPIYFVAISLILGGSLLYIYYNFSKKTNTIDN